MKRTAVWLGIALALLALVLFLRWQWRARRVAPPLARTSDVSTRDDRSTTPPPLPSPHPIDAPRLTLGAAEANDLGRRGTPAPAELARELSLARDAVERAARSCSRMMSGLDGAQSLRVRLRLVVRDGEGRVTQPTILDGTLSDATARACVLGAFASARWRSDGRDREVMFEIETNVGEMTH
jgi:hypothetical protein